MKPRQILGVMKTAGSSWSDDSATTLGAAIAYYTVFSIAPLLIIAISVAGLVFGDQAAQGQVMSSLSGLVGQSGGQAIQTMLVHAHKPGTGAIAGIVGIVVLLFGASGVFSQLQYSLNTIWKVKPKPGLGITAFIKQRVLSFAMVLGIGFLLLVSLLLSAAVSALGAYFSRKLPGGEALWQGVNFCVSFAVTTLLFAMMFKILPDVKLRWRDVRAGAIATAVLFTVGKFLIGLYLGKSGVASVYGAAGSLVIVLVWVYYSAQIVLYGAEFTKVYATRYGSHVEPTSNAVSVAHPSSELGHKRARAG